MQFIGNKTIHPGYKVKIRLSKDYPAAYASNIIEFKTYLSYLEKSDWIEIIHRGDFNWLVSLTISAWKELEIAKRSNVESELVLVAMWFDPDMMPVYREAIAPAIVAAGYLPILANGSDHNDRIDDEIIAKIRESRFLVADFTGSRGGVYFEAGFAKGLGLQVIWTCRSDWMDRVHFDTRQYSHIKWSDPVEFREQLRLRILATLGRGPRKS